MTDRVRPDDATIGSGGETKSGAAGGADLPPLQGPWSPEIAVIAEQIRRFQSGELPTEKFREFRLIHGMYGQRQPDVHMLRVKIPNGVVNADQLDALAEIAEHHGHGVAHLTTRQDVQYHHIPLNEFPELFRRLAPSGLGAREACGNSVRNVTSCPRSGVCRQEPFPVLPYAEAVSRFLLRHPSAQLLPRKFKIALSGCPGDCAAGAIHDIGAVAVLRQVDGRFERGFKLLVGGGTGSVPYLAQTLTEFLPAADLLRAAEAIVRIFSLHGNRKNRARARSKFVVATLGIEAYRALYAESFSAIEARDDLAVAYWLEPRERALLEEEWPVPAARPLPEPIPVTAELAEDARHATWLRRNVLEERDPRRRSVMVSFPIGDASPGELRRLASIARALGGIEARITKEQNILLRGVPTDRLAWLYTELEPQGLARAVNDTVLDVLTCPGADTCNLGITTSKGLGRALEEEFRAAGLPLEEFGGTSIKISGCPNGCSQHHVATIGLHGVARKVAGKQAPHYQLHLGGRIDAKGALIAKGSVKIPSRNAPRIIRTLLQRYLAERQSGEDLAEFLQRIETSTVEAWLGPLLTLPPPSEAPDDYLDWGDDREFSTANLGVGECAGAGVDLGVDPFAEVQDQLAQVEVFRRNTVWVDALAELNRAVWSIARITLHEGLGKSANSDWETLCEYRARLIDRGHAPETLNELRLALDPLLARKPVGPEPLPSLIDRVETFLVESRGLTAALKTWRADPERAPLPGLLPHADADAQG